MSFWEKFDRLDKALEGGNYNAVPSTLTQGSALQVEDLSNVMETVTFKEGSFKLMKKLGVEKVKATLVQFDRTLAYGVNGGTATNEGGVGQEENGTYVRAIVPMAFYSLIRKWTQVADMVNTVDGKSAKERVAEEAALKLQSDLEFDSFRGMADFSNAGVFDGNPAAIAVLPNMYGVDIQVRQSDSERKTRDLMFAEYGSDDTVVISCGSTLTMEQVQDARTRAELNWGTPDELLVDPKVHAAYNKIANNWQNIYLAGAPQTGAGASLDKQWVVQGTVKIDSSQWLRGKTQPGQLRKNGPGTPTNVSGASSTVAATPTTFVAGDVYLYRASSGNEIGESAWTGTQSVTISATADIVTYTVTAGTGALYLNIYRSAANGAASTCKFIGRVKAAASGNTAFIDLNNKTPGFVTGFLVQYDTMTIAELAPFTKKELAEVDLSHTSAFFRFCCLKVTQPRKSVLLDSLIG